MSIGDPYATVDDLKSYLGPAFLKNAANGQQDLALGWALRSASKKINKHCERQFNLADAPSDRVYSPNEDDMRYVDVDDFVLTDDFNLQTDPSGTGDFEVQWTSGLDYELLPLNGVVGGEPGWPYNQIHAVAGVWFPLVQYRRDGTVKLTALWGWAAVPDEVHQATLIMAHQVFKSAEAPFGVAGFSSMGAAVKVRDNPLVCGMLEAYQRYPILGL